MRIDGEWLLCDDGIIRPVIRGEILTANGAWQQAEFLVDTGADRTVFSAATLAVLGFQPLMAQDRIGGLGGVAESVVVETQVRLTREEAGKIVFRGRYTAVTDLEALDMNVLGRDIAGLFAVVVDRPRQRCLPARTTASVYHRAKMKIVTRRGGVNPF